MSITRLRSAPGALSSLLNLEQGIECIGTYLRCSCFVRKQRRELVNQQHLHHSLDGDHARIACLGPSIVDHNRQHVSEAWQPWISQLLAIHARRALVIQ